MISRSGSGSGSVSRSRSRSRSSSSSRSVRRSRSRSVLGGGGGGGAGQPHCSGALRRQLRIHCVQPAKLVVVLAMLPVHSALLLQLLRQDGDSWTPSPKLLNPESEHRSRS